MISLSRGLLVLATAGAAITPIVTRDTGAGRAVPDPDPQQLYVKAEAEYYLTAEELKYIRPGLTITVEDVTIPADLKPVVEVSFVDDLGQPLDRAGIVTPGPIGMSFILTWYDAGLRDFVAYTTREQTSPITGDTAVQASSDSGGSWEDLEIGRARYTFGTELPADYDPSVTHTVGIYASRNLNDTPLETQQYANVTYDFVPAGEPVVDMWQGVLDQTCNSCHEQLAFHGGSRRDVKLCTMCHNKQTWDPDTGNTVDMKVMIHKIHTGANLPSVQSGIPYQIIGYRQSVHDYSEVLMPQDMRNCDRCHTADTPEGSVWFTRPSRDACGSCHDLIDWEAPEGHPVPQFNDDNCADCHQPQGNREFDISVMGAHVIPTKSDQLPGINMEITDVTDAAPGSTPTVYFSLTNDDGSMVTDIAGLRTLTLRMAGPTGDTIDHTIDLSVDARGAAPAGDEYMMTFEDPIPADATGTWGFSADVRRTTVIDDGSDEGLEVTEGAINPIFYAAVTDDEPMPRREVVSLEKCNVCHDALSLHGGQRFAVHECLFCHRPNNDDADVRPDEEMPPESIDMRWLIHRLHTGKELDVDFTVYGYRSSVHNYNHVGYPGDLRTCDGCHLEGTYNVPAPEGSQEVVTQRSHYSPTQPAAAACLACHSTVDAAAHAYTQTAPFGESCAACHGDNRVYSVDAVHAH
ncbi:MAG: OmcA/MtrC family decaheme c-type cytochrome [Thermoanaerobaculales bacterium]|jgi:OmcA/MtrC family decaheme c-type cytochrome|nr:OmcA/MtrC family decaheme c-type cytochrome [Thermoanaerobaculales bacterium]